jgi:hypothetical protein
MPELEIPLLRESAAFAARLIAASRAYGQPTYYFRRRVNWSYRFGAVFYAREADLFRADPGAYLAEQAKTPPVAEDIYSMQLSSRQLIQVLLKVAAHWLFAWAGAVRAIWQPASEFAIYRKAHVDDIELVFDPEERGVLRAVYPFPISMRRQLRYLKSLRVKQRRHRLCGVPYGRSDLGRVLIHQDLRSLQRLESRAQIRHAKQLVQRGVKSVQLSDEFDIGSLDFTRYLVRSRIEVINSAHGVGKYFPVHAYPRFDILTRRQQQYYYPIRDCEYRLRRLNAQTSGTRRSAPYAGISLVFLSQAFGRIHDLIADCEEKVVARLHREFAGIRYVSLFYKPHPNCKRPLAPKGFGLLHDLSEVNGHPGTVFVSFFSTCQIDPAFCGRKILLRFGPLCPEIAFDDTEEILNIDELIRALHDLLRASIEGPQLRSSGGSGKCSDRMTESGRV